MTHPLDGCLEKLRWGDQHTRMLYREIGRENGSVLVRIEFDADESAFFGKLLHLPELPPRWSLILGDAIHNYRSVLDYLAYEVVRLDSGSYWSDSQFPIITDPAKNAGWRVRGTLDRLTPEHRALIDRHQPYRRGDLDAAKSDPLAKLADLSNEDKHRLLLPGYTRAQWPTGITYRFIDCKMVSFRFGDRLEADTNLFEAGVEVTGPDPQMEMNVNLYPLVGLSDERSVEETLANIRRWLVFILWDFADAFGGLPWPLSLDHS